MFKNFQKRNTRQDILNDTLPTGVMHGQDQGKSNTPNHQHHTSHKGTSSPALTLKPKDEITSNHRHSPMNFRSGNQEKSLDGDKVTLLHCVFYSHFEAHTPPKHGAACLSFF